MHTNLALKEWSVVVAALDKGEQIVLIRKGGIAEKDFEVKSSMFLFYPTFFHEMERLVDSRYQVLLQEASIGASNESIAITNWAIVDEIFPTQNLEGMLKISNHYVYTPSYIKERLDWRAEKPAKLLFVRVFRLKEPAKITVNSKYRGCKSWVDLDKMLDLEGSRQVMSEQEFQARKEAIKAEIVG